MGDCWGKSRLGRVVRTPESVFTYLKTKKPIGHSSGEVGTENDDDTK